MAYRNYLNKVMKVIREDTELDAANGVEIKNVVVGQFMCRLENLSSTEQNYLSRNSIETFMRIYTTTDADPLIKDLDTVLVEEINGALIGKFEIRRPQRMEQTQRLHHIELDAIIHSNTEKTLPMIPEPACNIADLNPTIYYDIGVQAGVNNVDLTPLVDVGVSQSNAIAGNPMFAQLGPALFKIN